DISNLQLIKKIIKLMNKSESAIEFVKDRLGHDRRYAVDYSKASKDLGYKPEYDLDTYLIKTINWYQENKDWWQTVKSGDYQEYYKQQYDK
ncbi:MAG: dTDP-glucose 4,6-dehydratase, partial [Patescibacteria group bacterium]|nr:dTDP-glucose 4,6-dehydratase [Patescibacteria group bacterium]